MWRNTASFGTRPSTATRPVWSPLLWGGLLVALTLFVYWPTLGNTFVSDDREYVVHNAALRSTQGLYDIWFTLGTVQQYYPIVFSSLWLDYQLWGLEAHGYHLANMLMHAVAAVLLWQVLLRLKLPGAWFAAAVFAVHPVHVESVAWISERKNLLSCAFALGALLAYWRFDPPDASESAAQTPARRALAYALALVLFWLSILSKSVTASLPAVILVVRWWKNGRLAIRDVLPLVPFFASGLGMGLLTEIGRAHV